MSPARGPQTPVEALDGPPAPQEALAGRPAPAEAAGRPEWAYYGPQGEIRRRQGEPDAQEWAQRARGQRQDGNPMPRRDTGDAARSIELRILRAWIDASRADSALARVAQFESDWLRIRYDVARQERDLGSIADAYLPQSIDPHLRQLFALPSNQAQAQLLGERSEDGVYHAGWADLSQSEFDALILWMTPVEERNSKGVIEVRLRQPWEIGRDMTPKRARDKFGRRAWVREDTALRYFRGALRKLRLLFGVGNADNPKVETGPAMHSGPDPSPL